ncbi:mechanosensitive ion channel family protein [Bifidobacterium moukalabense]|uniref:Transporter n=1 Tax=Bifidobacterium moukalabense DSM 27321 TaxID=1435051 RepID=W4N6P8_9BIFI|nr:mechanosensitive ion channel domain-containing protein [Bifidobacterium moukalabense]ETY70717.1 transporter [Bifidobacterium moukalabense DSM 27321]
MDPLEIIWKWLQNNYGRLIYLAIVALIAFFFDKALTRVVRRILDRSQVPNASIFVNILRVVVWVLAAATVLQPVFGVNPTTLFTALGIGGLAVSLGLKDTIANVIGGFGLMLGRVIQPGDYVSVAGTKGIVKDINWRQTVVKERNGNEMVIPNSILNTASLEKLDPSNECLVQVPFTAKAGTDISRMEQDIVAAVTKETEGLANTRYAPKVKLTGFSPYGIEGTVYAFAKSDLLLSTMADAVARAIANAEYLEHRAVATDA